MEAKLLAEAGRGIVGAATGDLKVRAERAADVAAQHALAVDSAARFPEEAVAALKAERLLGIRVPKFLGGEGVALGDVADICFLLGQSCSSTGMIYAMHQVKVGCITRHRGDSAVLERMLRTLCAEQLLLAADRVAGQPDICDTEIVPFPGGQPFAEASRWSWCPEGSSLRSECAVS